VQEVKSLFRKLVARGPIETWTTPEHDYTTSLV
jgi:hypothetical protein